MLVAFSSSVKLSKSVSFSGVKFRAKFEAILQFLSFVANHSKSDFSTVN